MDRVLCVLAGTGLAGWASMQFRAGGAWVWMLLYVALILVGVDFVVTGIRGFCQLYKRLGWSTAGPLAGS